MLYLSHVNEKRKCVQTVFFITYFLFIYLFIYFYFLFIFFIIREKFQISLFEILRVDCSDIRTNKNLGICVDHNQSG